MLELLGLLRPYTIFAQSDAMLN